MGGRPLEDPRQAFRCEAEEASCHVASRSGAVQHLLSTLWTGPASVLHSPSQIDVVGHRVVHGGPKLEEPVLISPEVKSEIAKAAVFAPLHNRAELEGIEIVAKLVGSIPQVAVFDTAFHSKMPPESIVYPGPYKWFERGIKALWLPRHQPSVLRRARFRTSRPITNVSQNSVVPLGQRLFARCGP